MTPEQMLEVARSILTEEDVRRIIREAVQVAVGLKSAEPASAAARTFLAPLMFPRDPSVVEDKRFKRVVFCTYEQYNEVGKLRARCELLEEQVRVLKEQNEKLSSGLLHSDTEPHNKINAPAACSGPEQDKPDVGTGDKAVDQSTGDE